MVETARFEATADVGETAPEDLRKRKVQKTRDAIVASAIELFDRKGFEATTVDDIAKAAQVSRRTVFRHFGGKEEILFFDWSDNLTLFRKHLSSDSAKEPAIAVVRRAAVVLSENLTRDVESDPEVYKVRLGLVMNTPALTARYFRLGLEWERVIAETVSPLLADDPAADLHAHLLAAAVFGSLRAVLLLWTSTDCQTDLTKLTNEAFDVLEGGIFSSHG